MAKFREMGGLVLGDGWHGKVGSAAPYYGSSLG